jgi:phage host-nuclease inhibitor protein Gam
MRTKVKVSLSTEQFNKILRSIGELDIMIERKTGKAQKKINEIKAQIFDETKDLAEKKKQLELQLKAGSDTAYAEGAFAKAKSLKFLFGEVSFHKSTSVATLAGIKMDRAVELCHESGQENFIRTTESIDKEIILGQKLSEAALAAVGLRYQVKDEFGYKTDREKIISALDSDVTNIKALSA